MKPLHRIILLLLAAVIPVDARNFYFSSSVGSDHHTVLQAQDPATPWKTIEKLNQSMHLFEPGDSILFRRGDQFRGMIRLTASGNSGSNLVLAAYGKGRLPVITGLLPVTDWTARGGNIWEAECPFPGVEVTGLLINGIPQRMGRYPDTGENDGGYLEIESHSGDTRIVNAVLSGTGNWTGAEALIRVRRWTMDRIPIATHTGNTLILDEATSYPILDGFGFFIQDHPGTLSSDGEWYFDPDANQILLYLTTDPNLSGVEITRYESVFYANQSGFFSVEDLELKGSAGSVISVSNSDHIAFRRNMISFSGLEGADISSCNYVILAGNRVHRSGSNGLIVENCNNVQILENRVSQTGLDLSSFNRSIPQSTGMFIKGNDVHCQGNIIDSAGFNGIYFLGDDIIVKNNFIRDFCLFLDDGAGIYTWNQEKHRHTNRRVESNIILNGIGAPEGTDSPDLRAAKGIYLDHGSDHITIAGNSVAHCSFYGILVANGEYITISDNTLFDNGIQLGFYHDQRQPLTPITHCTVDNNIFFSRTREQLCAEYRALEKSDIFDFGTFSNNYYCRPLDEDETIAIYIYATSSGERISLREWQDTYLDDQGSSMTPYQLPIFEVVGLKGSNLLQNGSFDQGISGWKCVAGHQNGRIFWEGSGILDGGCLGLSVTAPSGDPDGYVHAISDFGTCEAGEDYLVNFSIRASDPGHTARVTIYNGAAPYNSIAGAQPVTTDTRRTDHGLLLRPHSSADNARIEFMFGDQDITWWLDNVELYWASVELTRTEDSLVFLYNAGDSDLGVFDGRSYQDVTGQVYHNFIIGAFESKILLEVDGGSVSEGALPEKLHPSPHLYPNPATDRLFISADSHGGKRVTILESTGRQIYQAVHTGDPVSIDLDGFPPGAYFLRIGIEEEDFCARFLVQ